MNAGIMEQFRDEMSRYYYDPDRYDSYLEQLGVQYPTLRQADGRCAIGSISQEQGG